MRYATIKLNDVANGEGVCISLYTQGCPHHCKGCFNADTWNYESGQEFTKETEQYIINNLNANNTRRDLCILGGEPFIDRNYESLYQLIIRARKINPDIKIYVWSGYTKTQIDKMAKTNKILKQILQKINYIIDGKFDITKKDITLKWRGSSNQNIWEKGIFFWKKIT